MPYMHGTYGEFAASIGGAITQSDTVAVYIGTLPINLVRGYADKGLVNAPIQLRSLTDAQSKVGYSADWNSFTLSEAVNAHFNNSAGNVGPIVAINVLDPDLHRKAQQTTEEVQFANGRAVIDSDTIILDTLVLADMVEGVDFSIDYDFTTGQVLLDSIGERYTGEVSATYYEVDPAAVKDTDIIGGVTANGVYRGLSVIALVYQELNLIPNLIVAPKWSADPDVYQAMIVAGTKINGHWDAFVLADIPLVDGGAEAGRAEAGSARVGGTAIDSIAAAIDWAEANSYNSERTKIFWPQAVGTDGNIYHLSTLAAWAMMIEDAENGGVPMGTASNKPAPLSRQYFGQESQNRGFDQQQANELNEQGISTAVYFGGQWVLWGGHTAAYKYGAVNDNRVIFDNSIRTMMYISNNCQQRWATTIDEPMTLALADTILHQEQEQMDALVAVGALIGSPTVQFIRTNNPDSELIQGNFVWSFEGTPTPQFKSGLLRVAYTDAGFSSYFDSESGEA